MAFKKAFTALILALPLGLVNGLTVKRAANAKCSFLVPIVKDLQDNLFTNECGDTAHSALRLIFHDAIGFSKKVGGGGADGSIAVFNKTELNPVTFPGNLGVDDDLDDVAPFLHKYANVLSPGDFIQLAGAVSLAACPGAPRVQFAIGRPPPKAASPEGLVPQPQDPVKTILARMADATFSPEELIALLSSHSIAGADDIDPRIQGVPFDETPSVFDTQIFVDVQLRGTLFPDNGVANLGEVETAIQGTLRLESDHNLARDSATSCIWQSFVNNQEKMTNEFGAAVFKLSLLGQNVYELTDCSEVIPQPPAFNGKAHLPAGSTQKDIEQACATAAFPILATVAGPAPTIPPIPQA